MPRGARRASARPRSGESVARAIGRKFVRISLGGVRDEAEIRGHRRTYVGALPGRIIQGIKKAGTNNPVFVLDEIDKLGHDFRGDPAAALLEVLDPEQNSSFSRPLPRGRVRLSKVLFIATANQLDPIPWALRDRLEIIELPGYTRQEKKMIARKFLVPKQLEDHGLTTKDRCEITDDAIFEIVDSYTREAGVRNLEREIGSVCRAVAVKVAEGQAKDTRSITPAEVEEVLGPQEVRQRGRGAHGEPGVATGLAWTAVGGDILFIEATQMPGKGKLTLTGQLGDVMKESVTAALSFVRGRAAALGLDPGNFLENNDLHVHVPAGAVPKDGPSAGVTMYTALVSLLTGVPVRPDVAMTGEITLRGNVLPIGGVKEKLLAAHRAGIKRVIIPERNVKDLIDVPDEVKKEMEILSVKRMDEVLALALKDPPTSILDLAKAAAPESATDRVARAVPRVWPRVSQLPDGAARATQGRLVCDACGGILMSVADFEHAVIDFGAQATSVQPRGASERMCPRCDSPMQLASFVVDKRTLTGGGRLLHAPRRVVRAGGARDRVHRARPPHRDQPRIERALAWLARVPRPEARRAARARVPFAQAHAVEDRARQSRAAVPELPRVARDRGHAVAVHRSRRVRRARGVRRDGRGDDRPAVGAGVVVGAHAAARAGHGHRRVSCVQHHDVRRDHPRDRHRALPRARPVVHRRRPGLRARPLRAAGAPRLAVAVVPLETVLRGRSLAPDRLAKRSPVRMRARKLALVVRVWHRRRPCPPRSGRTPRARLAAIARCTSSRRAFTA